MVSALSDQTVTEASDVSLKESSPSSVTETSFTLATDVLKVDCFQMYSVFDQA